jgi:hypothetical protein
MTAFELIEQLKRKQDQERQTEERVLTEQYLSKQTPGKELVEMRAQEKIYFSVKDYDRA